MVDSNVVLSIITSMIQSKKGGQRRFIVVFRIYNSYITIQEG